MSRQRSKLRNITFSADADLIANARRRAKDIDSTLNDEFRAWLEQFSRPISSKSEYQEIMTEMRGALSGARFSRDEANER